MTGVQPFRGDVVRQEVAHDVVSPAYDALTIPQRRQFRADHPNSYLHVTRSAEDEPDGALVDNATLVRRGRASLERMLEQELFCSHGAPAFYVYRLDDGHHAQRGLVAEVPADYYASIARPHEATRPERTALLAEHFETVKAASSPVACAVRDDGGLQADLESGSAGEPILDMTSDDGLRQTVWRIDDRELEDRLVQQLREVELFIIDGHHRSAANQLLRAQGTLLPVLVTLFPEQSLHLVGFHRLLKLPASLTGADFVRKIARRFRTEKTAALDSVDPGQVGIMVDDQWHLVHFDERPVAGGAQIRLGSLDPVVLEREILQALVAGFGPVDVTYMPDELPFKEIAEDAVRQGRVPIFVPPVAIADMMAVAAGGVTMPAKSTYFTPKVRSGVFLRLLDDLG